MIHPRWTFGLFVVLVAVQLALPLRQIWQHEDILRTGTPYKFRTAPVDPYDAFRGRYVALNYADTATRLRPGDELTRGAPAYVTLLQDEHGFARFGELSGQPPATGDYLRVEFLWSTGPPDNQTHFRLPFDRYFMKETKAPQAEVAYWQHSTRLDHTNDAAYVLVRVKHGRGVIEDLYISNLPVREFLMDQPKQGQPGN